MNETKKHLFLFTIGPVQSFITQARKTQDLYAGSALLSDLIAFALSYTRLQGHEIIFPYFGLDNKINLNLEQNEQSYPNRFIAVLNFSSEETEKVKVFGQSLENLVRVQLENLAKKKFEVIPAEHRPSGLCEQIKDFLEIYWTAIPYDETPEKYSTQFKNLESYLGAIKNVRSFNQLSETGRKCTVNGTYNVKVYRKTEEEENLSRQKIRKSKLFAADNYIINGDYKSITYRQIQPGEGLCGISFFKRFYKDKSDEKQKFPSTAEIALQNIETNACISTKINSLKDLFKKDFDYQLLFDENLTEDYFKKNELNKKHLDKAKDHFKEIRKLAKDSSLKMNSYYALLSFDGDSMGEWLSKAKSEEQHRDFSKLLVEFANKAKAIVDKEGKTVYAGGDDFLGFVNLEYLFDTIEKLKAVFDAEVTKKVKIENGSKEFTMSMGVVIAHYKMPLNIVINKAKAAEKAAKNSNDNKDALAVDFSAHSGNSRLGIIPFGKDGENLKKVEYIFKALQNNFSSNWIRSFTEEFYLFPDKDNEMKLDDKFKPLMETELKRLILRAYKSTGENKKDDAEALKKNVYELFQATDFNYSNFTEMLYITSALVSKTS
jgi:CRISPR-associated protein Cmr2